MTDLQYQIALTLLPGIGDISGKKFVQYCGSAEAIFKETRKSLEKITGMREASIDAICKPKEYLKGQRRRLSLWRRTVSHLCFSWIQTTHDASCSATTVR